MAIRFRKSFEVPTVTMTASTLALALIPSPLLAAKHCKKGKPCGNSCIAANKTCHIGTTTEWRSMDVFVQPPQPTSLPPVEEQTTSTHPTSGFSEASQAALACGRAFGAVRYQAITIELVVDGRGEATSASAAGSASSTLIGQCVAEAAKEHFRFSTSEEASRHSQYTFVVGSPDSAHARGPTEARTIADPAPARKQCRREDFEDFDAFVECRVAAQGSPPAPAVASPGDRAERERQRETAEARAELGRKTSAQMASEAEEERRAQRALLSLAISGGVLEAAGIGLVVAAVATGESVAGPPDVGPSCTLGKRCGNTCIAVELTCHAPTPGGSFEANPRLSWPGFVALAAGSGLLAAALIIHQRKNPRTSLLVTARGVGFRF